MVRTQPFRPFPHSHLPSLPLPFAGSLSFPDPVPSHCSSLSNAGLPAPLAPRTHPQPLLSLTALSIPLLLLRSFSPPPVSLLLRTRRFTQLFECIRRAAISRVQRFDRRQQLPCPLLSSYLPSRTCPLVTLARYVGAALIDYPTQPRR